MGWEVIDERSDRPPSSTLLTWSITSCPHHTVLQQTSSILAHCGKSKQDGWHETSRKIVDNAKITIRSSSIKTGSSPEHPPFTRLSLRTTDSQTSGLNRDCLNRRLHATEDTRKVGCLCVHSLKADFLRRHSKSGVSVSIRRNSTRESTYYDIASVHCGSNRRYLLNNEGHSKSGVSM